MTENPLLRRIQAILGDDLHLLNDAREQAYELAAQYDEIEQHQRDLISEMMFSVLKSALSASTPLDHEAVMVLALSDPWLLRSHHGSAARLLLSASFREQDWEKRSLDDLVSIGNALAELDYVPPDAVSLWQAFFLRFSSDPEKRIVALDVALAGLSIVGVEGFAAVATAMTFDAGMAERWQIYLPALIRSSGRAAVASVLGNVLQEASSASSRDLLAVARAHGLRIESHAAVPADLRSAITRYRLEKAEAEVLGLPSDVLAGKRLHVVYSDYAGDALIDEFQNSVVHLVQELDPLAISNESKAFAELPQEGTLQRRFVYTFPTYLTEGKRKNGYAVLPFGHQRRLGAVVSNTSVLLPKTDPNALVAHTLEKLVGNLAGHSGSRVYTLQNFAMGEMVLQALAKDPRQAETFDLSMIQMLNQLEPRGDYIPPQVGQSAERTSVFIFDLAGMPRVNAQIAKARRHSFLKDARVVVLEHDLDVPVGVGFNRYAADWAAADDRWTRLQSLVSDWVRKPGFVESLRKLGIDVDAASSRVDHGPNVVPIRSGRT